VGERSVHIYGQPGNLKIVSAMTFGKVTQDKRYSIRRLLSPAVIFTKHDSWRFPVS